MTSAEFVAVLQMKWQQLGGLTQGVWDKLLDITTDDPTTLWFFYTMLITLLTFWIVSAFFTFIDVTHKPQWIFKYKIQPRKNLPVDKNKLWKAIKQVLFNQIAVTAPQFYVNNLIMLRRWTPALIRQLPSMKIFLIHLIMTFAFSNVFHFYIHRLLHHPLIYKYIHLRHHEWTAPIAITAFYVHPFEQFLANFLFIFVLNLLKLHLVEVWTFLVMIISISITDHSGFYIPFTTALHHDYHHLNKRFNISSTAFMDKLYGTLKDNNFEKSLNDSKKSGSKLKLMKQ